MFAGVESSPHDRRGCSEAAGHTVPPPAWKQGLMLTTALCSSDGGWMKDVRWDGRRSAMQELPAHTAVGQHGWREWQVAAQHHGDFGPGDCGDQHLSSYSMAT